MSDVHGEDAALRADVGRVSAANMPAGVSHEGTVLQGVLWRQARRVNAPAWTALRGAQRGMALALIALADDEVPE